MVAKADNNPTSPCPICRKPTTQDGKYFPFCCDRCKTIDLAKWADGSYTISRSIEQDDLEEDV